MKRTIRNTIATLSACALACAMAPLAAFAQAPAADEPIAPGVSTQQAADEASGAQSAADAPYVEDEILVNFKDGTSARSAKAAIKAIPQADEQATLPALDLDALAQNEGEELVIKLDETADATAAVKAAEALPQVESAQLNYRYQLLDVEDPLTNDPALASYDPKVEENAWHLHAIDIEGAWAQAKCQGNVTVAVLDTGCDMEHEDLQANVLRDYAYNAYRGEELNCDYYGHGTHVAGCVAAEAGNGVGTAGSSYNAKILPVNVFDAYGSDMWSSTTKALVDAYDYLLEFDQEHPEYNLHVVNMSLGGYGDMGPEDYALQDRIAKAKAQDIVSVCAGGNGINGIPQTQASYPSDYEDCVAVTALSTDEHSPTYWCDFNEDKDICVPGEDIYSTVPRYCKMEGNGNWWDYEAASGTSMATPIAAGVFALLWAARPDLTVEEAVAAVEETASDALVFSDDSWYSTRIVSHYGKGILQASAAVSYVKKLPPNQRFRDALTEQARQAQETLDALAVSTNGKDVPENVQWVFKDVYDEASEAIAAAKNAALAEDSYEKALDVRDALEEAVKLLADEAQQGTLKLASAEETSALKHALRNALIDLGALAVSADGTDVAEDAQWVTPQVAQDLADAVEAAQQLLAQPNVGEKALQLVADELAFAAQNAAASAQAGTKGTAAQDKPAQPGVQASAANEQAVQAALAKIEQVIATAQQQRIIVTGVTVNEKTVTAKAVAEAIADEAGVAEDITTITLGKKVKKVKASAFAACTNAKTLVVKTKKLKKASVKGCLKGSAITSVQVNVGKNKANKKTAKKLKKIFTKKVAGKKAKVTYVSVSKA